jgi:hypothetical protein
MSYNSSIPQSSDDLVDSQPQILANFQVLAPFGNGYADFPVQGSAPSFPSGDTGLYNLNNATTTANETYIVKASVDAPTNVAMSASKMSNTAMASCQSGWSYLPSGLLMKWGKAQVIADGAGFLDVASMSGGPNFNQIFTAYITPVQAGTSTPSFVSILNAFPTAVTGDLNIISLNSTATTTAVSYLVLGV